MTKDEYLYALASVKMDGDYCDEKQYYVLQKLIEEHFDNPPLKFEDLHEGMWVWDEKNKIYNLIYEKRINCAKEKEIEFQWEMPDRECQNFITDVYEENRFYRREVQQ